MEYVYPQISQVWSVTGGQGEMALFTTRDSAERYAKEYGGHVVVTPVRAARSVWHRVFVDFTDDYASYAVHDCEEPLKPRNIVARHPSATWFGSRLEVCARTEKQARAIADYVGRRCVGPKGLGQARGWGLVDCLTGAPLDYIMEDGTLMPCAPKWMEIPDNEDEGGRS